MREKNYKVLKDSNFNCYKSYIDFISCNLRNNDIYSILVLRKDIGDNLVKVNIIVKNCFCSESSNEFYSSVILSKECSYELIDSIRNDFMNNHTILCSVINPKTLIQTLQNTNFSLNIKLFNCSDELDEALKFNQNINKSKYRALTRN